MQRLVRSGIVAALVCIPFGSARAKTCEMPKDHSSMKITDLRERAIYQSYLDIWDDEDKPTTKIYFVLPSENGKDSEVFSLEVRGGAALEIKPETLQRLTEAKEVRLYNPTKHPSLYLVPFAASELSGFDPKQHCSDARENRRHATQGCSTLSPGNRKKMTLFYGEYAEKCDAIARIQRKAGRRKGKLSSRERAQLEEAVSDLNDYFSVDKKKGPYRRPGNLAAPVYADEVGDEKVDLQRKNSKKLPILPAGKNNRTRPVKTKETRGAG